MSFIKRVAWCRVFLSVWGRSGFSVLAKGSENLVDGVGIKHGALKPRGVRPKRDALALRSMQ